MSDPHRPQNVPAFFYCGQTIRAQVGYKTLRRAKEALRAYIQKSAPLGNEDEIRQFLGMRKRAVGTTDLR